MKEYERVVGGEGSVAVSPPRDGAAWALGIICFWGAESTALVSLLILINLNMRYMIQYIFK